MIYNKRIEAYRRELRDLGIRDYQVPALDREMAITERDSGEEIITEIRVGYRIVHLLVLLALSAIPFIFLNLPVRILADIYAEARRKKALSKSKVKIYGYDVMLTEKLVFCIATVPILWLFYGLMLYLFTDFDGQTMTLCFMSFPLFAYVGIVVDRGWYGRFERFTTISDEVVSIDATTIEGSSSSKKRVAT